MSGTPNECRKRRRENEVKKWTDEEIQRVLSYMQANRRIEKPTARIYYNKLLEVTKIDATWNTLKCKVRHLKGTLQKAEAWCKSTATGCDDDDGTPNVNDKLLDICPHYIQLSDIFLSNKEIEVSPDIWTDSFDNSFLDTSDVDDRSIVLNDDPKTSPTCAHKEKHEAQGTGLEKFASVETQIMKFKEKQLELEREKFEWTKEVERKKLEMERVKMENEFQLKIMELEQNEKIRFFEIEMKYRCDQ